MSEGLVTLEVTLHEDEDPQWAEWELWRNTHVGSDRETATWIGHGTSPSMEAALDAVARVLAQDTATAVATKKDPS